MTQLPAIIQQGEIVAGDAQGPTLVPDMEFDPGKVFAQQFPLRKMRCQT